MIALGVKEGVAAPSTLALEPKAIIDDLGGVGCRGHRSPRRHRRRPLPDLDPPGADPGLTNPLSASQASDILPQPRSQTGIIHLES